MKPVSLKPHKSLQTFTSDLIGAATLQRETTLPPQRIFVPTHSFHVKHASHPRLHPYTLQKPKAIIITHLALKLFLSRVVIFTSLGIRLIANNFPPRRSCHKSIISLIAQEIKIDPAAFHRGFCEWQNKCKW